MTITVLGLSISAAVFWLALALIFLLVEALTAGLATIWFAAGAFLALIASLFSLSFPLQLGLFLISSICLLVFTRKIFVEKLKTGAEKTNVEAIIGERGLVIAEIGPFDVGQVKVNGQVWSAIARDPNETIQVNEMVKVVAVVGVKLIVNTANR